MSTTEAPCFSTPETARLTIQTLPFERIPHQSKLFIDYLHHPDKVSSFYNDANRYLADPSIRVDEVLKNYVVDRISVCDALERLNRNWGAGQATMDNIARLRGDGCVAVVSGQQAGLFSGPLYTIFKALSAVKLADCLTQRGTDAVPVFWIATEDHDFAEVAKAEFIGCDCGLTSVDAAAEMHHDGSTVGSVVLNDSIHQVITRLVEMLPSSEFMPEMETLLRNVYRPGVGFGDAFARLMAVLTERFGLIMLDPRDHDLKRLAAPLYSRAAMNAHEIGKALEIRSRELVDAGYHAQVLATEDSFPLFIHSENDVRHSLSRVAGDRYRAKGEEKEYTAEELANLALQEPQSFSPNVTLRAVVQDYLLPTIVYYGGAAEVAYFAQTSEVYRLLERPVTPILHRASMTIVESRTRRTLERYGLKLEDFFEGPDAVIARVVEGHLAVSASGTFNDAERKIDHELERIREALHDLDPTLAEALDSGKRKITHQLEGLKTRFQRSQIARDEAARRQIENAFCHLYPNKALQERHINALSLVARHGRYVIDWIYEAISLNSSDHQVVFL